MSISHAGPLTAGLAFLPVTVGIGVGAGIASQAVKRVDVRAVAATGLIIGAVGFLLLLRIAVASTYVDVLLPALIVMSVGLGITFVPVTLVATTNVATNDAGLASGLLNTSQQVGGSLGLAILATLAANATTKYLGGLGHAPAPGDINAGLVQGYHLAFLAGAVLLILGAVLVGFFVRRSDVADIAGGRETITPAGAAA